jgi:hypothetical protein
MTQGGGLFSSAVLRVGCFRVWVWALGLLSLYEGWGFKGPDI